MNDSEIGNTMMNNVLGIDIGSVAIGVVELSPSKNLIAKAYRFHHGEIAETLERILNKFAFSRIASIAVTSSTPAVLRADRIYDNQIALISAAKGIHGSLEAILNVGGEKFSLIQFDEKGAYRSCKSNTSCAAGTGSFLDQQALRLNLSGIEELSRIAFDNNGNLPKIASRCAVFAKTDLIHAQQEGYFLDEISDGLCYGLAKNLVDTLFSSEDTQGPIVFCGGVSRNRAVTRHISKLIGNELIVDDLSYLYGAYGAANLFLEEESPQGHAGFSSPLDIIINRKKAKKLYFEPLQLKLSQYPDFSSVEKYNYQVKSRNIPGRVEVDIYEIPGTQREYEVYLGIDVGSTSTKAVILDQQKRVLAGFYTWTAGRPVDAVCAIFESIDNLVKQKKMNISIIGAGTTGSGRKLIGRLLCADIVLDEITAHARAACELDPDVDTIIEIGGQDSKFTTLKNSIVTFSTMNAVCAAGTGSFIEEQARKFGCPLDEYSKRTQNKRAPMSSDRCTVFMERDMNHYLSEGYAIDEVLASALHSVCENYLTKVAIERSIGDVIFFQGATAKNKALVAALEHRLQKPIKVSKFCHLTGAMGTALVLKDEGVKDSGFRGIDLFTKKIPVRSEVCSLCANHCKLTIAEIDSEQVAYGFLCGRDYNVRQFVNNNISGFDLLKTRQIANTFPMKKNYRSNLTVGIPAALHLVEDLEFWRYLFNLLGIKTITSENYRDAVSEGKNLAGAEFCAPMAALHGHVSYLMDKADYVFVPFYLEQRQPNKKVRRQHCYYTHFAPALVASLGDSHDGGNRLLTPVVQSLHGPKKTTNELYRMLRRIFPDEIRLKEVIYAFDAALAFKARSQERLRDIYYDEIKESDGISVVLLGRPYTILSPAMNKGIIDILAAKGIKTFFQDMLSYTEDDISKIKPLLDELHWRYAAEVLEATEVAAKTKGVYPVMITSFHCAPDSFVIDYFKQIMNSHEKPYLILHLDEHDSNVGYETRIEAAIRAFRNHNGTTGDSKPVICPPVIPAKSLGDKTIIFPKWDYSSCPLLVASLKREGLDARLLEESETSMQKSLKYNTGQCIPLSILAQEFIDYVEAYNLDPARCVMWMGKAEIACNLKMIPHYIKGVLNAYGNGMEKAEVYHADFSMMDISLRATLNGYLAFMFGGMLRRISCKIRPYEIEKGTTDRVVDESIRILSNAFEGGHSKERAIIEVVEKFQNIAVRKQRRAKVAIFGDLYVRDNDLSNQGLVNFIEENGGEVITTPYSDYMKMIADPYFRKWMREGKYLYTIISMTVLKTLLRLEKRYYRHFKRILNEPEHVYTDNAEKILARFHMIPEHTGESMDNILKTHYIKKYYPDVALFIQTSPAFCCPSLVTEAMSKEIQRYTGVPVVSVTYDGTCSNKNQIILPYLKYSGR